MPPLTIVKRSSPIAGDLSLHVECLRKGVLPSLAYGGSSCSLKWKVEPQWRHVQKGSIRISGVGGTDGGIGGNFTG